LLATDNGPLIAQRLDLIAHILRALPTPSAPAMTLGDTFTPGWQMLPYRHEID
jgi:hypothetical protein